jgi:hypothetical protein
VAETDLKDEIRAIKQATRAELEWEVFCLRGQLRLFRLLCPNPDFRKPLAAFLNRRRGPKVKRGSVRAQLDARIRKLPYDLAAGKSNRKIAKLLGASDRDNYTHQQVGDLINFVMENFTSPKPGESRKLQRNRALDIILRSKLEE